MMQITGRVNKMAANTTAASALQPSQSSGKLCGLVVIQHGPALSPELQQCSSDG